MSTIREWLTQEGFDWEKGDIVIQVTAEGDTPGWGTPVGAFLCDIPHEILDKEFHSGFGGPNCPRFVAQDHHAIYFPWQYDGATGSQKIYTDIHKYLDWETNKSPYPGG